MSPTILAATEYDASGNYHSSQALTDDVCDAEIPSEGSGIYNYWLSTSGAQGWSDSYMELDFGCIRTVSMLRVRNSPSWPWNDRCAQTGLHQ